MAVDFCNLYDRNTRWGERDWLRQPVVLLLPLFHFYLFFAELQSFVAFLWNCQQSEYAIFAIEREIKPILIRISHCILIFTFRVYSPGEFSLCILLLRFSFQKFYLLVYQRAPRMGKNHSDFFAREIYLQLSRNLYLISLIYIARSFCMCFHSQCDYNWVV